MKKIIPVFIIGCLILLGVEAVWAESGEWECPECGNILPEEANFCNNCGTENPSSEWECPACGSIATGKFCSNCGASRYGEGSSDETAENGDLQDALIGTVSEEELSMISDVVGHVPANVRTSPDKYTYYVQDYVGRNVASVGYTSLGGERRDEYGVTSIKLVFVTSDGTAIDVGDTNALQQYVVVGQNVDPDTEIKLTYLVNSEGEEYSNLIASKSIDEIELRVARLDGKLFSDPIEYSPVSINSSPDRYTHYIRNYVGRNLSFCGYTSLNGERRDEYGVSSVKLELMTDDGSYIDPEDKEMISSYCVVAQNIEPNSEMKIVFMKNSQGEEYDNLVESTTYNQIILTLKKVPLLETSKEVDLQQPNSSEPEEEISEADSLYDEIVDNKPEIPEKVVKKQVGNIELELTVNIDDYIDEETRVFYMTMLATDLGFNEVINDREGCFGVRLGENSNLYNGTVIEVLLSEKQEMDIDGEELTPYSKLNISWNGETNGTCTVTQEDLSKANYTIGKTVESVSEEMAILIAYAMAQSQIQPGDPFEGLLNGSDGFYRIDAQLEDESLNGKTNALKEIESNPTVLDYQGATAYIGQSLDSLIAKAGSPEGSEYMDEPEVGRTGYHYYTTFTVSTIVDEEGNEIVNEVW